MESGLVSGQAGKNPKTGEDLRIVRYRIRDNYAEQNSAELWLLRNLWYNSGQGQVKELRR